MQQPQLQPEPGPGSSAAYRAGGAYRGPDDPDTHWQTQTTNAQSFLAMAMGNTPAPAPAPAPAPVAAGPQPVAGFEVFEGPDPQDVMCTWQLFDDQWCYARNSRWAYQLELMVYRNLSSGEVVCYDAESDGFVRGSLRDVGGETRFVPATG